MTQIRIVASIFIADWHHLIFFSNTPYLALLGWVSLRLRRVGWRGIGFGRSRSWAATFTYGIVCGTLMEASSCSSASRSS